MSDRPCTRCGGVGYVEKPFGVEPEPVRRPCIVCNRIEALGWLQARKKGRRPPLEVVPDEKPRDAWADRKDLDG